MAAQPAYWTSPCRRSDMARTMMIFGGLFASAIVLCGTLEARVSSAQIEQVEVVEGENVIGPVGADAAPVNCDNRTDDKSVLLNTALTQHCAKESVH